MIYRKAFFVSILITSCSVPKQQDLGAGHKAELNQAETPNENERLLSVIMGLEPAKLYTAVSQDEILASAMENREPRYLAVIQEAYGIRVREFVGGLSIGESREERIGHGINLINLMSAACSASWSGAIDGGWYGSIDATDSAAMDAAESAAWNTANSAARNAANSPVWNAANSAAESASIWMAAIDAAWEAARSAEKQVLAKTKNLSHQEIGRLAYRTAEVTALLYFLKSPLDDPSYGIQEFFSRIYQASNGVLKRDGLPADLSIWESQEAWDAFYTEHFGKLTPDALAFLTPYLCEINKTWLSLNPQS